MNKKGIDFSFSWIFAIIAGAVILFSAIYITSQLVGSGSKQSSTIAAGELANILSPIETNLEDNKYSVIEFSQDTKVFNECSLNGAFGVQKLRTAPKKIGGKGWSEKSVAKSVYNKYIFSDESVETESKKIKVITNPLFMPFKVGDAIIMYSKDYCFVNTPEEIKDLINDLSANGANDININLSSNENCPSGSVKVCFDRRECDVSVYLQSNTVSKNGKNINYEGVSLMLAAIFSEPEIYECQLKRIMKRAEELGVLYSKKAVFMDAGGCSNNLVSDLQSFVLATNISSSREISRITSRAKILGDKNNELASCKVF